MSYTTTNNFSLKFSVKNDWFNPVLTFMLTDLSVSATAA